MPRNVFLFPGKANAGDVKAYLASKDIPADVTCYETDEGDTTVDIDSATDPTPVLGGFQPPERGAQRRVINERLTAAKSIADLRGVLTDMLQNVGFSDD